MPVETAALPLSVVPYVRIARVDHWFKNLFMLLGVLLAFFIQPAALERRFGGELVLALLAACLIASSNYVLNEILDAPSDGHHPDKRHRPVPSGLVRLELAYAEWMTLGLIGIAAAFLVDRAVGLSGLALWVMGIVYNVRPLRTKELPYLDVLSESVNNALRLLLGWFVLIPEKIPPVSLLIAFWMFGAFFMALKRFAEYRTIGDKEIAARYRRSFAWYDEDRLLVSCFFYAVVGSLFGGIFIVRYHLELILLLPVAAAFLALYLKIGLRPASPVQRPEKLYRERALVLFGAATLLLFLLLMFVRIRPLYDLFNVAHSNKVEPLWTFESR